MTVRRVMRQTPSIPILLVSDAQDDSLREAIDQLRAAGARVDIAPDVYDAMARLARGERFYRVAVDARTLDRAEAAFMQLAPRYFDDLYIEVPWLDGTTRAVVQLGQPGLKTTEVAAIAEAVRLQAATAPPAEPVANAREEVRPQSLSTDGTNAATASVPSLHEAVRMRMAEGESADPVRRRPPSRTPPGASMPPPIENRTLTPEEISALLNTSDAPDGNGGRAQ